MNTGALVLVGSGEFTNAMLEVDRYLLQTFRRPRVAILPTAAGPEPDWWKWVTKAEAHFRALGVQATGIPIRKLGDARDNSIVQSLKGFDMYYFSGGHPGHLLNVMKDSPAWRVIKFAHRQGAILAGCSAGAMVCGSYVLSNIYGVFERGETFYKWDKAFSFVPYIIWPHFDFGMHQFGEHIRHAMAAAPGSAKAPWLGIDEETAVIWQGVGVPKVMGKGKAHWGKGPTL